MIKAGSSRVAIQVKAEAGFNAERRHGADLLTRKEHRNTRWKFVTALTGLWSVSRAGGKAPVFSAMAKNQPAEFAAVRNREHAQSARSFAAMKSR
jgi:hypothetical protein